jgi:hypothetical protein
MKVGFEEQHPDYIDKAEISASRKETNDCSVISTAIAYGISYKQSHDAYKAAGRKKRRGSHYYVIHTALASLKKHGHYENMGRTSMDMLADKLKVRTLTFNNILDGLRRDRNYLLIGKGHMVAVKDGRVADWAEGTRKHVETIYEIKPPLK